MTEDELIRPTDGSGEPDEDEMFADLGHFQTGAIPVDAVLRRGKAIRKRRRALGGGMLAAAAALAVAAPVALAGGSGRDVSAGSGPRITVNRPTASAGAFLFSGTFDGKRWSLRVLPNCDLMAHQPDSECMVTESGSDTAQTPVDLRVDDVRDQGNGHYFYELEYAPETDFAVVTLSTGDQVTVPGIDADSVHRIAWFPAPRSTPITRIAAYGKDGTEIGHTPEWGKDVTDPDVLATWYRPDGTTLLSAPNVGVASGTTGGVVWSIESTMGKTGRCFLYRIGSVPSTVCPGPGVKVIMDDVGKPGPDGVVVGEVAPETMRVDVTYKDGSVQHLTPVRSNGHVFVGTYVPHGAGVVSITPVTGTNS